MPRIIHNPPPPLLVVPTPLTPDRPPSPLALPYSSPNFEFSDVFETGPMQDLPELAPSPELHAFFDTQEAREYCDNEECLGIMQEIAEKNSKPLRKDNTCYLFEREPKQYSLNQALHALSLHTNIQVSCSNDFFQTQPRIQTLSSLEDLVNFWNREKARSLL